MFCMKCGTPVKMAFAVVTVFLLTGGSSEGAEQFPLPEAAQGRALSLIKKTGLLEKIEGLEELGNSLGVFKTERLPKNQSLHLEEGRHGIELVPEELPPALLVIDVDELGYASIPDIGDVSDEEVTKEVKKRVDRYGTDFLCMIRADKDTPHRHVRKVMRCCEEAGMWKFSFVAGLSPSEDRREAGFSMLKAIGPSSDELKGLVVEVVEEAMLEEIEPPPDIEQPPDVEAEVERALLSEMPPLLRGDLVVVVPSLVEPQSEKESSVDAMINIKSPVTMKSVAGTARNAGTRGVYTKGGAQYGDANTERAVMKALRWLKATQSADGSWGTKPELGLTKGMDKAAGAGFAVLTFLAHGETPASKEFGPTVEKTINYLINNVYVVKDKNGNEVKDPNGLTPYVKMRGASGSEYGFLIGTYALCEAYAMTKNPNARVAAEKALARIISGQTPTGGWNYNMARKTKDGPDDISYGGWALQALKAGKMAGIHLPGMEECIKKAVKCLKTRNYSEKAGFVYRATTNHKGGGGCLAGVGCLAMQLLGYAKEPEVANALRVMTDWQPSLDKEYTYVKNGTRHNPQYYCYYATLCKYQAGMARNATPANLALWKKWNTEMKKLYPRSIITVMDPKTNKPYTIQDVNGKPREIGHWVNQDHYNYDVMGTCLAALQLMVYYRYLPTTMLRATEVEADVESLSKEKSGEINVSIDI